jgi:diadenosine tetraphosphate (Ap4A) HIT family hydrolase
VSEDCIFCAIAAGRSPASVVGDDGTVLAFLDISPMTPGHTLVVPRAHAPSLALLDPAVGAHLFTTAMRVAAALRASGLRADGVNVLLADGEAAGQDVFHVHLHVVPRFPGDGLEIRPRHGSPTRAELDATAAVLAAALPA